MGMRWTALKGMGIETDIVDGAAPGPVLWGVAPTGPIHLGYVPYIFILRSLSVARVHVSLLIANYHAYLDSRKSEWRDLDERTQCYRTVFARVGLANIIESKHFYMSASYIERLFQLSSFCRLDHAIAAGRGTLRSSAEETSVADAIYIATQLVDIIFLRIGTVLCGFDEAPIYSYGLPLLSREFEHQCSHIYVPSCPGVLLDEMHASDDPSNKIELEDTPARVLEQVEVHCAHYGRESPLEQYCIRTLFPLANRDDLSVRLRQTTAKQLPLELARGITNTLSALRVQAGKKVAGG